VAPAIGVGSSLAQAGTGGAGAPNGDAHAAGSHIVVLKGLRYHPSTITINRGESVTWEWRDNGTEHNVTAHGFRSRTQTHGSFSVRFTHAGTFNYHCTIHVSEGMVGKVIVH
jgi:plastocyanin